MAERFKAHAWNACWAQALAGSNPVLSAKKLFIVYNLQQKKDKNERNATYATFNPG